MTAATAAAAAHGDPKHPTNMGGEDREVTLLAQNRDRILDFLSRTAMRIVLLVLFLLFWNWASDRLIPKFVVSTPVDVWHRFGTAIESGELWNNLLYTFSSCFYGFVIGSTIGSILGLMFGLYEAVAKVVAPFANMLYSMPKIMLSPVIVVWLGVDQGMKVFIATLSCMWVVFYNVWNATRRIDHQLLDQFRLMGASQRQIVFGLYVPSATTWLLTSLRIAFPIALIGAVVGEFVASSEGLGHMALQAGQRYDTAAVFVAAITITFCSGLIDAALGALQRRVALRQGEAPG